jgi:hypothetical protein
MLTSPRASCVVGDTRQHEAVEAGRPYRQLQKAGIETARLDEIVRQKDPALKEVVEQLSRGNVREAIEQLDTQGRVHEIPERDQRIKEIAREYAAKPEGTLVVSPDNQSRREINEAIHRTMQNTGSRNCFTTLFPTATSNTFGTKCSRSPTRRSADNSHSRRVFENFHFLMTDDSKVTLAGASLPETSFGSPICSGIFFCRFFALLR